MDCLKACWRWAEVLAVVTAKGRSLALRKTFRRLLRMLDSDHYQCLLLMFDVGSI